MRNDFHTCTLWGIGTLPEPTTQSLYCCLVYTSVKVKMKHGMHIISMTTTGIFFSISNFYRGLPPSTAIIRSSI